MELCMYLFFQVIDIENLRWSDSYGIFLEISIAKCKQ